MRVSVCEAGVLGLLGLFNNLYYAMINDGQCKVDVTYLLSPLHRSTHSICVINQIYVKRKRGNIKI